MAVRVLSIVPYKIFPAKVGGQKGIALFNEYLAEECELVCVTVQSNQPQFAKGYQVLNILTDATYRYCNIFSFFTLRKLLGQLKITHLLLEHPYFGWLGIMLKMFTGVRLIVHSHNIESVRWKTLHKWWWKLLWWYERAVHRYADYNFFIHDEDRKYAIDHFGLKSSRCITVTYGIETDKPPAPSEKNRCSALIRSDHSISESDIIFLFNGALDYLPNYEAVKTIVEKINPFMLQKNLSYKIIICGRGLPASMNELKDYKNKNIIFAGFVNDISAYFKGADVFINPVVEGGGIKTKLVESLGYDTQAISTANGSIGVSPGLTGGKLLIVPDYEWAAFAAEMCLPVNQELHTPPDFYESFYWGNIARTAANFIKS